MLFAAVSVMLVYTSVGMVVAALIARPPTGPGFWRLTVLLALTGIGLGGGIRLSGLAAALPHPGSAAVLALAVASAALIVFGARKAVVEDERQSWLLALAAIAAVASIAVDPALQPATGTGAAETFVYVVGLLTVASALGSVLLAMLLAHWYLIEPRMPIAPLNRVLGLFLATEGIKLALVFAVVAIHLPAWNANDGGLLRAFVLGDALFVAVRATLGVLAPLVLGWMTWKTVQIRSIQSATGILYAAIVFVLFGEVISLYLSLSTGRPF